MIKIKPFRILNLFLVLILFLDIIFSIPSLNIIRLLGLILLIFLTYSAIQRHSIAAFILCILYLIGGLVYLFASNQIASSNTLVYYLIVAYSLLKLGAAILIIIIHGRFFK